MCGNILRDIHGKTQQNICGEAVCQVRNRKLSFFPCGGGMCLGRVLLDLDETLCVCVCVVMFYSSFCAIYSNIVIN